MKKQDLKPSRSSPGAFPASLSPPQENRKALRMNATYGRRCAGLLQNLSPVSCLGKMLLASSIWGSTKRSLTWQKRDTLFSHSYFRLAVFYLTPVASDGFRSTLKPSAYDPKKKNGNLAAQVIFQENPLSDKAALNPDWVEWLMGFPKGWTELSSGTGSRRECPA